jgi:TusA-related sulfurtransferase
MVSAEAETDLPMMELDLRGSICPGPTADTLAALKNLPPGGKLAVVTDYLPARQTIPRLLEERGCSWQMTEDDGKTFRMEIVKGE